MYQASTEPKELSVTLPVKAMGFPHGLDWHAVDLFHFDPTTVFYLKHAQRPQIHAHVVCR